VARPIAKRRAGPLTFFHHKRPVSTITDFQPPVGDNGIDLCVRVELCPPTRTALEAAAARFASNFLDNYLVAICGNKRRSKYRRNYDF